MVEYGLLVALLALVVMSGASMLGTGIADGFERAAQTLSGVAAAADDGAAATAAVGGAPGKGSKGKSADAPGHGDGSGGGKDH